MGSLFSRFIPQINHKIALLGLDAAGKTTMLYQLNREVKLSIPTIGLSIEQVRTSKGELLAMDLGGRDPRWRWRLGAHLLKGTQGIIFMIDGNDRERFEDVALEFHATLENFEKIQPGVPIAICINKSDLPRAADVQEIEKLLGMNQLGSRKWHIQQTIATSGKGIPEVLKWIQTAIMEEI